MSEVSGSPIRIGISACLLGEKVRYDGGHKRDSFIVETLGRYVEWVPVCPEVEMGLGTPRETLRLVRIGEDVRMVRPKTGVDHTDSMRAYASRRVAGLATNILHGYILKKDSPSCGMERVRVFDAKGVPVKSGRGLFAEALLGRFPPLPVEEEGRLTDPRLRENFIERVFAYYRLRLLFSSHWKTSDLVAFHTAHKLLLMAHSPQTYAELGRLVAGAKKKFRAGSCTPSTNASSWPRSATLPPRGDKRMSYCILSDTFASCWMPTRAASFSKSSRTTAAGSCRSSSTSP